MQKTNPRKTVALVEDDVQFRAEIEFLLKSTSDIELLFSVGTAELAIERLEENLPDVVLMDIHLPGMQGVDCAKILKRNYPTLEIVMLTVYEDASTIFRALKAGANGYLIKSSGPEVILSAVRDVTMGGAPFTSHIARKIVSHFRGSPDKFVKHDQALSPREKEVLELMAEGYRYKEVADKLSIGIETVKTYVKNICVKLHVRNRIEAIVKHYS
jgi:DNA-binding NarL/FixJ family response regulator